LNPAAGYATVLSEEEGRPSAFDGTPFGIGSWSRPELALVREKKKGRALFR
jgi:hypothetical protein